jgi:general stress protein 26
VVADDHDIQRFEDLLQAFDHAMLVSVARDGTLHARPMAIAESDGAVLRFATSNRSAKTAEVAMDPRVSVVMQGNGAYLAISGKALATGHRVSAEALSGHGKFFFG